VFALFSSIERLASSRQTQSRLNSRKSRRLSAHECGVTFAPICASKEATRTKDGINMRIELQVQADDPALAPLRSARAQSAARHTGRHAALAQRARAQLADLSTTHLPSVVREPLSLVSTFADLIEHPHWQTTASAREQFAGALAYFVDPDDLIPDDNEFGYLDDALLLKLTVADAQHEWLAWCDYRDYLAAHPEDAGIDRSTWLLRRRERFEIELRRRNDAGYAASGRRDRGFATVYTTETEIPRRFGVR
jgi:uncharacterized membrane protein YkvA (DUF1232 family)